jgi:hypothetical protein
MLIGIVAACGPAEPVEGEMCCRCIAQLECDRQQLAYGSEGALLPDPGCVDAQASYCLANNYWYASERVAEAGGVVLLGPFDYHRQVCAAEQRCSGPR